MDSIRKKLLLCLVFCAMLGTITAYGKKPILLTQSMLDKAKGSFVIKQDYTASGAILYLPEQLKLVFDGGKIDHAELMGNHSTLQVKGKKPVFGKDIRISGVWDVEEVHDGWFEFEKGRDFISNQIINNMLAFSNDSTFCHLFFEEDRVYYFELPYKERVTLGDKLSYHMDNGEKKRHYGEIYYEKFSYLAIFTIPSNTTITLNSTLQMLPTNLGAYYVFWEDAKENVTIEGSGTISGDNKEHLYDLPFVGRTYFGEWGILFRCYKCRNFVFRGITLRDAFGDCIVYEGSHNKKEKGVRYADGLLLEDLSVIGARRNGVAIGARDVVVRNCHFEGCGTDEANGTLPRSGIDFEPDGVRSYPEIGNQNVLMENCTFKNNYHDISSARNNLEKYGQTATTIRNCVFPDPIRLVVTNWLRFENCYISSVRNIDDDRSVMKYCKNITFVNCEFGKWDAGIPKKTTKNNNSYINCKFNTAKDNKRIGIIERFNRIIRKYRNI
ncbi:MAG: right-handed parallel beta-helix repeat-containing protein, partial [Bacteroidales bacterium]|nr:right-handed parallel beta-helix repeat-containing protein [Bacteroidales bacterium]